MKERKVRVKYGKAGIAVNFATEGLDFVDALYKTMRDNFGGKSCAPRDYQCKLRYMYKHWTDPGFDIAEFMANWLNNELEDLFYGRIGRATGAATRDLDVTTGIGGAVRRSGKNAGEQEDPVPELYIEDGLVKVKWSLVGWE